MMERLTFDGNYCDIAQCAEIPGGSFCEDGACSQKKVWERLKAYESTGLTPEEVRSLWGERNAIMSVLNSSSYDRIRELAEADKDGRLLVLPCKVGDTVYRHEYPVTTASDGTQYYLCDRRKMTVEPVRFCLTMLDLKSKFWVTREEAEAAMEEAKKNG